jgi:hypothetical protein
MLMSRSPGERSASLKSDPVVDPTELRICVDPTELRICFEVLILSTIECP